MYENKENDMGTDCTIYRAHKLTPEEIENVHYLAEYHESYDYDSLYAQIRRYEKDNPSIKYLVKAGFVVEKNLLVQKCRKKEMFRFMGFPEESIEAEKIHIHFSSGYTYSYTDGNIELKIHGNDVEKFEYFEEMPCCIAKLETLFDDTDENFYGSGEAFEKLKELYPQYDSYEYIPADNEMLAEIEVPFLIYKKNYGKCFINFCN